MTLAQYEYEERAAIIAEGCGVSRERAEWMARKQIEEAAKRGEQGRLW